MTATIDTALHSFSKRWGVQPNGILINSKSLELWQAQNRHTVDGGGDGKTFRGIPIYTSPDIERGAIRFVL